MRIGGCVFSSPPAPGWFRQTTVRLKFDSLDKPKYRREFLTDVQSRFPCSGAVDITSLFPRSPLPGLDVAPQFFTPMSAVASDAIAQSGPSRCSSLLLLQLWFPKIPPVLKSLNLSA